MQFSGFFAGQSEKMARGEFRPGSMANVICLIFTAGCPSLVRPIVSAISNPSDCWKERKSLSSHHALMPLGKKRDGRRSEEHTSELQSLMRISYAVFCLKKKKNS